MTVDSHISLYFKCHLRVEINLQNSDHSAVANRQANNTFESVISMNKQFAVGLILLVLATVFAKFDMECIGTSIMNMQLVTNCSRDN